MHRKKRIIHTLILFVLMLHGCTEEYVPDLSRYDELLVVDGTLTNQPGPYIVTLTRSDNIYNPKKEWIRGAVVSIIDDNGNTAILSEELPGRYVTLNENFRGEPGREYKLRIELSSGKIYESEYQLLNESSSIDSVYSEIVYQPTEDINYTREGLQFYIDAENDAPETDYLLWRMTETYLFNSDFTLDYIFNGRMNPVPNPFMYYTCYRQDIIPNTLVYSAKETAKSEIKKYPLTYVDTESRKLTVRYSLKVFQYAISEEAYKYWHKINKQNEEQGSFYSRQPFQIKGNLMNINAPDESVMGFFMVAGLSTKRIFVDRPTELNFYHPTCVLDYEGMGFLGMTPSERYPVYISEDSDGNQGIAPHSCVDCRLRGGNLEKPDYWK